MAVDAPWRLIEVAELHRVPSPPLLRALDSQPNVAARAALALGRIGNTAAVPALRSHVAAPNPSVRAMSAYALGLLGDGPALGAERTLLRRDANSAVRYAAADAIGRIVTHAPVLATQPVASDLEAAVRSDADAIVRAHAVIQLDAFGHAGFAGATARALEDVVQTQRDPDVRWHAMWTLYRGYATRADATFLRHAAHDPQELVRVEALRAWGKRRDGDPATFRSIAMHDPSWRVQLEALEVLRHLRGQSPTQHQTAIPAFVHLPPLPLRNLAPTTARRLPAHAFGSRTTSAGLRAPDPASLALAAFTAPTDARGMNGPLPGRHPRVVMRTTKGDVVLRFYPEWAPSTVANFLGLAARGYYDHNRWFRIVPDFVDQSGDARDNADDEAGFTIPAELNPIEQRSGIIAMGLDYAHGHALRDSAGTQFYLTLSPQLHLDRDFTVFGEVERGTAVLAHLVESDRIIEVRRIGDD